MIEKKFELYLYFCIFIFFFLLGIILYYSFGYKYNINENKTIQTGAIILKTSPKEVTIYENNKLYKNEKTIANLFSDFIKIENLESKEYNIKVKKEGYFEWEKNINVKSGAITELKNIVLLKNNYDENILINEISINNKLSDFWINDNKNKIIYKSVNNNKSNLIIFDVYEKNEKIIANLNNAPFNKLHKEYIFDDVIFSNNNSKILLKIKSLDNFFWYLIDFDNKNKIYNLTSIFGKNETIIDKMNLSINESIFYINDNVLYELNYKNLSSKKILENLSSFLIYDNYIYYIKSNDNSFYYYKMNDLSDAKEIVSLPENFDYTAPAKIIKSAQNTFIILSSLGKLYFVYNDRDIDLINSFVQNAFFSNGDKRIYYYNNHEIWVYYIEEKKSQPRKEKFTNELVTRFSGNISNLFIYKDEEHIFYQENNNFMFAELDNRDKKNIFEIMKVDNNDIFYLRDLNSVFYIKDNKIIQINIDEE